MELVAAAFLVAFAIAMMLPLAVGGAGDGGRAADLLSEVTRSKVDDADALLLRNHRRRRDGKSRILTGLYRIHLFTRLEQSMWQAGLYMRVSEMLLIVVLMTGGGLGLGQLLSNDGTFALATGLAIGALPFVYIHLRRKRRLAAFNQQLPFALDLIKSSLEAGHTVLRGLQVLVQEFADPLGAEFRTMLEQTRLGMTLPRAFDELLKRVPEDDLRLLVVAVKVQNEVGSSLAHIIGRLSEIVRIRQRLQGQIRAMTAQSRMSGIIVALLPVFVLAAFTVIQPTYTKILLHDPMGIKAVKVAMGLDLIAFLTIRRILRVDY